MTEQKEPPSIGEIRQQFVELPVYAPVRAYIRGAISLALGDGHKRVGEKALSDKECVTHSLIVEWLEESGYQIAAQMMKTQMGDKLVETPSQYVKDDSTIDSLLSRIHVEVPKLERRPRAVKNGQPFRRWKEPLKIDPLSDEEFQKTMREKLELERKRLARFAKPNKTAVQVEESDESSSESSESSADSASDPESPKEKASWKPSELTLVTDQVSSDQPSDPLPAIFSAHLPPLVGKPVVDLEKKEEDEIDALFGEDYDLDDFEEDDDKGKVEEKVEEVKKPESVEPLVLSEGESIDELEDFDTGLLSSGGSDYSF